MVVKMATKPVIPIHFGTSLRSFLHACAGDDMFDGNGRDGEEDKDEDVYIFRPL